MVASLCEKSVLCIAEAFGFGPASKLTTLLYRLAPSEGISFTFLGNGCAYELCRSGPFDRVLCGDPIDLGPRSLLAQQIPSHQTLISAMEFTPLPAARRAGLRTIVFDSLFWMWPNLPCQLDDVDLYLCQNFIGVRERCLTLGKGNLVVVPPLTLPGCECGDEEPAVILNFGGVDNPFAERDDLRAYADCMCELAIEACEETGLRLEVYGRQWVVEGLRHRFASRAAGLASLPLLRFADRLRRACALITSPGLEVLYEAFSAGVPVFMLPPQNNSQAYQAQCLQHEIPHLASLQYPVLIDVPPLARNVPPAIAIKETLSHVESLRAHPHARQRMRVALQDFLAADAGTRRTLRQAQFDFLERMRQTADVSTWAELRQTLAPLLNG